MPARDRGYEPPAPPLLDWVAGHVHARARVIAVERLLGGITADMDRVTLAAPSGTVDVVLRRWPDEEWTAGLPTREAAALTAIRGHPVPAPRLLGLDEDGTQTGVRCTLTSSLPGRPDLVPADLGSWLEQLAAVQATIHAVADHPHVPAGARPGSASPSDRFGGRHRPLEWLADPGLRADARAAAAGPAVDEDVFVHGDFQHFNVLWCDGRLTGVVDWPNASVGSRGADVGHCRLNLAVLFRAEVADDYLVAYERAAGVRVDRRADLRALLCFDPEWQHFIPRQVAGRAPLDVAGMPDRVAEVVRTAVGGIG